MKNITVTYFYNHPSMGFSNQVTVDATSDEQAVEKAKQAVSEVYGSDMLKKFSFKIGDKKMEKGGTPKQWFKQAIESTGAPGLGGWKKTQSQKQRIRHAYYSHEGAGKSRHEVLISAAKALQALANVTTDAQTKKAATDDAHYFYMAAKEEEKYAKGGTPKQWFKQAIEAKPPYTLHGWRKELPAAKRRAAAIDSRPVRWSRHKKYLSAARALQALANVSTDAATKQAAKADADYFFEKAKGKKYAGGGPMNKFTDYYLVVNLDERGDYSASVYDPNDKSVYEIESAQQVEELIEDGFLKYKPDEDLDGLTQYLMDHEIIPNYSQIYSQDEFDSRIRDKYSDETFAQGGIINWDKDFERGEGEGMEGWTYYYGIVHQDGNQYPFTYIEMITDVGGQETEAHEITWAEKTPKNHQALEEKIEDSFNDQDFETFAQGGQVKYTLIDASGEVDLQDATAADVAEWANTVYHYDIVDNEEEDINPDDLPKLFESLRKDGFTITEKHEAGGQLSGIRSFFDKYFDFSALTQRYTLKEIFGGNDTIK